MDAVALRKESVDRNENKGAMMVSDVVALRKESVDRNLLWDCRNSVFERVALRKESVDRNRKYLFLEAVSMGRSPQGERG